jgi:methyl-accepting chemotaxis protein
MSTSICWGGIRSRSRKRKPRCDARPGRCVTGVIDEITVATTERSTRLSQINQALSQLDHSTQQNAALVDESAAAAEQLREQAAKLAQAVGEFKLARG